MKAITSIRRITTQNESDYLDCKRDGYLIEWPDEEHIKKAKHPNDFKLKEIKFLNTSQYFNDRYNCDEKIQGGLIVSNQMSESPIMAASHFDTN